MKIVINENPEIRDTEIIINCKSADGKILGIIAHLRAFDNKYDELLAIAQNRNK